MSGVFFYTGIIGFFLGVFVRSFFDIGLEGIVWVLMLSLALGMIWGRKSEAFSAPYLLTSSIFLFLFALGILRFELAHDAKVHTTLTTYVNQEVTVEGVVAREPDIRETNTHLYVDIEDELLLVTVDRHAQYAYGDRVRIKGVVEKPEAFETDLGRTFNYPGYLAARGVVHVVRRADVSLIESDQGNIVLTSLLQFKHAFMKNIETVLPEPHAGLSEGLLLGVKRALGSDLEEVFRRTGIIHIVVLSGYNIMLVVIFVTYILSYLFGLRTRTIFAVIAIATFALIVGLTATVVRASIMASLVLVAQTTGQTYAVMRGLMFAGLIMLLINPYLLAFDVGFQLSFLATMGLILVAPYIERKVTFMPTTLKLREFLTATLATQLFVLPILLYQIGEFSVVSVIVNVLVLPMVPVSMLLTFITGLIAFTSVSLAVPFAYLTYLSLAYILVISQYFASIPFASFMVPAFPFVVVPICYAGIGYVLWRLWKKELSTFSKETEDLKTGESKENAETKPEIDPLEGWTIVEDEESEIENIQEEQKFPYG